MTIEEIKKKSEKLLKEREEIIKKILDERLRLDEIDNELHECYEQTTILREAEEEKARLEKLKQEEEDHLSEEYDGKNSISRMEKSFLAYKREERKGTAIYGGKKHQESNERKKTITKIRKQRKKANKELNLD